jgi:hypothetical protein
MNRLPTIISAALGFSTIAQDAIGVLPSEPSRMSLGSLVSRLLAGITSAVKVIITPLSINVYAVGDVDLNTSLDASSFYTVSPQIGDSGRSRRLVCDGITIDSGGILDSVSGRLNNGLIEELLAPSRPSLSIAAILNAVDNYANAGEQPKDFSILVDQSTGDISYVMSAEGATLPSSIVGDATGSPLVTLQLSTVTVVPNPEETPIVWG